MLDIIYTFFCRGQSFFALASIDPEVFFSAVSTQLPEAFSFHGWLLCSQLQQQRGPWATDQLVLKIGARPEGGALLMLRTMGCKMHPA